MHAWHATYSCEGWKDSHQSWSRLESQWIFEVHGFFPWSKMGYQKLGCRYIFLKPNINRWGVNFQNGVLVLYINIHVCIYIYIIFFFRYIYMHICIYSKDGGCKGSVVSNTCLGRTFQNGRCTKQQAFSLSMCQPFVVIPPPGKPT